MDEQEVTKDSKKVYKIWNSKEYFSWHKLKKIVIEIFIIVFGVTLSIQLQSWNEHKHEQQQVKTFLLGLKKDLQADITDLKRINDFYKDATVTYTFLSNLEKDKVPNRDTLEKASSFINSNIFLRPHKSRFSGFSSAGKLLTIENDELVQAILHYYESTLPQVASSEGGWVSYHNKLNEYLTDSGVYYENTTEIYQALTTTKGKMYARRLIPWPQIFERYQNATNDANKIIATINQMYQE